MKYLIVLLLLGLFFLPYKVLAQHMGTQAAVLVTPTPEAVSYQLPYPGILPDNPLYPLKIFRDRLVGFLIADPLKKTEFNLLQADKRLEAGVYLLREKKYDLAYSTISKSQNYLREAFQMLGAVRRQGIQANEFAQKLQTAARKHEEVIEGIETTIVKNQRLRFAGLTKRAQDLVKEAGTLIQQE